MTNLRGTLDVLRVRANKAHAVLPVRERQVKCCGEEVVAFESQLEESLRRRDDQVANELARGDSLRVVLTRYLLAVEAAAETDMLTSILLLENSRLRHGAAPNLPTAYCNAIDGAEIGPVAGSCGTAAYLGHPIYVADIASDFLWDDYRHLALEHGLRACWSTPILDERGAVVGTFAIYHLTPRSPTREEVAAIRTITQHVARAIVLSSTSSEQPASNFRHARSPALKIVGCDEQQAFRAIEENFGQIGAAIDRAMGELLLDHSAAPEIDNLRRAKMAAVKAATRARQGRLLGDPS